MNKKNFVPHHINAATEDLAGNNGIGRYILLPGSDGRAKEISQYFDNLTVKSHSRGHHLYLGTLTHEGKKIDVATISSGMGCASMEIILHELFHLGGKRFLRIGTAGSLQPNLVKLGDMVIAQASVRDEHTSTDYFPLCIPAVASFDFTAALSLAAKKPGMAGQIYIGTVHCKSSLYAREFGSGPQAEINQAYIKLLTQCGVLASEMETSALFIQSQLYNYQLMQQGSGAAHRVLSAAILGIISDQSAQFASSSEEMMISKKVTELALEAIRFLHSSEQ